jgi:hypothetical protein
MSRPEEPRGIFGMNVTAKDLAEVSRENVRSTEVAQVFVTPTVVDTGAERVLFDTGLTGPTTVAAIESAGQGLVILADLARHPAWSPARPDWEMRFDADKAQAAESRRRVLGMIAADRVRAIGCHMPVPPWAASTPQRRGGQRRGGVPPGGRGRGTDGLTAGRGGRARRIILRARPPPSLSGDPMKSICGFSVAGYLARWPESAIRPVLVR